MFNQSSTGERSCYCAVNILMKAEKVICRTRNWKEAARYPGIRPGTDYIQTDINALTQKRKSNDNKKHHGI